jgi:hypothetical protein
MIRRMIGAARLDAAVFEEIERDPEATNQAFMVVVMAGVAGGIGNVHEDAAAVTAGITSNLGGWSLSALLAWLIGTHLFGSPETSASWSELARTLGFAYTPVLLSALGFLPVAGEVAIAVGWLWFAVASVVALRHALDFSTARAVGTAIVCVVAVILVSMAIFAMFGASLPAE